MIIRHTFISAKSKRWFNIIGLINVLLVFGSLSILSYTKEIQNLTGMDRWTTEVVAILPVCFSAGFVFFWMFFGSIITNTVWSDD